MVGIVSALILSASVALAPAQSDRPLSERELMRIWGQSIAKTMPASIKKGGTLRQLQYAFTKYCTALSARGVANNDSLSKRVYNLVKEGSASKWTCGDHSTLLESLFQGMGVPGDSLVYLRADSLQIVPTPNSDHGAVAALIGGKLYVFDAWQVARIDGSFDLKKRPERQLWNGLEASRWELQMLAQGYKEFSIDGRENFKHIADALEEYLGFRKGVKPPPKTVAKLWTPYGDPKIYEDAPRAGCTIGFEKNGKLVSRGKWGYPAHPGVSPLDFIVEYDITVPERLKSGEKGEVSIRLVYNYIQQDLQARGYTMSVEVHAGVFPKSTSEDGGWARNVGATNFLKVVAACNDESPHNGGVLHPVSGKKEFDAPAVPPDAKVRWYFALQFYVYGSGTPTARVVQVYRSN